VNFGEAKFHWIYDIRRGPDGNIYVLDSRNFAVRLIDLKNRKVKTIAGTGKAGYEGDRGKALNATSAAILRRDSTDRYHCRLTRKETCS